MSSGAAGPSSERPTTVVSELGEEDVRCFFFFLLEPAAAAGHAPEKRVRAVGVVEVIDRV